jgi:hypothetical protein
MNFDFSGDFSIDIWMERVGWWQYNYDLERQFGFTSNRLHRFITKRYTISPEWTMITTNAPIITSQKEWEKMYMGQWTNIISED